MLKPNILDLTYRPIYRTENVDDRWIRNHGLRDMLLDAYKSNDIVECEVRLRSLCWCANAFDISFIVIPVTKRWTNLTERIMAEHGLILIYEDLNVLEGGGLLKRGYRIGNRIPTIESAEFLRIEFTRWLKTKYNYLSADSKVRIIDRWRTFIIDLVREI